MKVDLERIFGLGLEFVQEKYQSNHVHDNKKDKIPFKLWRKPGKWQHFVEISISIK